MTDIAERNTATAKPSNPVAALSPYELRHLVSHMSDAGLHEQLHSLLRLAWVVDSEESETRRHNAWFELKEAADERAGFVTDIETAWDVADAMAQGPASEGAAQAIGLSLRYALITASLSSRAANIPAGLLLTLTRRSAWTPGKAIASAMQLGDHQEVVAALAGLAEVFVPLGRAEDIMVAAEEFDDIDRGVVLSAIAAVATSALLEQLVSAAESIHDEPSRVGVLVAIADAPDGPIDGIIRAAAALQSDEGRAIVLAACAAAVPPEQLAGMTAAASKMRLGPRLELLAALVPRLPDTEVASTLETLDRLRPSPDRITLSVGLARRLPEPVRSAWFTRQRKVASKFPAPERALMFGALGDRDAARKAARSIRGLKQRVEVLSQLAPYLDPAEIEDVLHLLGGARKMTPHEAGRALVRLTPYLPDRLLPTAVRAAIALDHSHPRADALRALAPRLPPRSTGPSFKAAMALKDLDRRGQVLKALAPNLPPEALDRVVTAIGNARAAGARPRLLSFVADYLSDTQVRDAFRWAVRIGMMTDRTATIGILAPRLPEDLLDEAVAALEGVGDRESAAEALANLARLGSSELVPRAMTAVTSLRRPKHAASMLEPLATALSEADLVRAGTWALQASDLDRGMEALAALAPRVVEGGLTDLVSDLLTGHTSDLTDTQFRYVRRIAEHISPSAVNTILAARRTQLVAEFRLIKDFDQNVERAGHAWRSGLGPSPPDDNWPDFLWGFDFAGFRRDDERTNLAVGMTSLGMRKEANEVLESITSLDWRVEALARMVPIVSAEERAALVRDILDALRGEVFSERGSERHHPAYERVGLAVIGGLGPYVDRATRNSFFEAFAVIESHWPNDADWSWDISRKSLCQAEAGLARSTNARTRRGVVTRGLARFDVMLDARISELAASALASCVDHESLDLWLKRVREELEPLRRAEADEALVTRLQELGDVGQAFDIAVGIESPEPRRRALHVVGASLTGLERDEIMGMLTASGDKPGLVRRLATRSRPLLLGDVAGLAPAIAAAGGEPAINEVFEAIVDVTEWWP